MTRITNIYDDKKYYFIQINDAPGKRITAKESEGTFAFETDKYDHVERYEVDKNNLLRDFSKIGAGQTWVDELIQNGNRTKDFTSIFDNVRASDFDKHFDAG